jgi:hypothetical protein
MSTYADILKKKKYKFSKYNYKKDNNIYIFIKLFKYTKHIDIHELNSNTNPIAIYILKQFPHEIDWYKLSENPAAIDLLKQNKNEIITWKLCKNPAAGCLLDIKRSDNDWFVLSSNPLAIHLLEQNKDNINWHLLSKNPAAIHLLEQNPEKIDWYYLSGNPAAIHLLEQNPDKIDWECLLYLNPRGSELLYLQKKYNKKTYINKKCMPKFNKDYNLLNYSKLSKLPEMFDYDYDMIKKHFGQLNKELIEYYYHPKRMNKWIHETDEDDLYPDIIK